MGYRFILFTYRQNKLAKWISGQEQYVRDLEKPKVLKRKGFVHREPFAPPKSVISKWEATCRHMRDAERAAVQYGMRYSYHTLLQSPATQWMRATSLPATNGCCATDTQCHTE
eukprot:scaffold3081_cov242-Prasinococcus_capsulatus_cf.AAC.1